MFQASPWWLVQPRPLHLAFPVRRPVASPERVARIYLGAAVAGNCELTAALTLAHTWNWCEDPGW